jgi:hypothetical protein
MLMNINADKGTKVVFANPNAGYPYHQEKAKKYLEVGKTYIIDHTVVGRWHTDVFLEEFPDVAFNSVMFDNA